MKTKRYSKLGLLSWFILGPMTVTLTLPRIADAQDGRRYERREDWRIASRDDRRRLEGTWYLNGERDKPCRIVATHDGFEARNEHGETSSTGIRSLWEYPSARLGRRITGGSATPEH